MPKNRLTLAIFSLLAAAVLWVVGLQPSQAYTYNNYEIDDLSVSHTSTSLGATDTITLSFTVPDNMSSGLTTSGSVSISLPYLYKYTSGSYTSDYVDISSATISSSQLTLSYQGSSYASFTPKTTLSAGSTITVTITGAVNPDALEGTGTFSVYGSEYNSSTYNWFWGSASQAYGDVDLTVTMYDADGSTPRSNVSVGLSYYSSNYSDYEYHYGYTNSSGQVQFAGLTSGRTYTVYFYYSGTATNNDPPVAQTVTFSGTVLTQSYNFVTANVSTHYKDINGNAISNASWYFYKTDYTNYYTDYIWRWGTTDSTGLIIGAAQLAGSYKLYIQDPTTYNYDVYDFTVNSSGVVSGLSDPIQQTAPEVTGTVTAGGSAVSNAYVYIHDATWQNYKYEYTDSSGNFSFDLNTAGTYSVEVSSYGLPSGYFAPDVETVSVTPGTSNASLTLSLEAATKTISGTVKKKNGDTITNATIYAYQSSGSYRYISDTVDSNGTFELPVAGGAWNVYIYQNQWPATWAYTGSSLMVTFNDDATSESATLNIKVKPYNSHLTGRVLKPDGTAVGANDVYVYIYGGENNSVYGYDYTDANGEFDIATTDGTFSVYVYFYGNSGVTNLSVPSIASQTIKEDKTMDLGDIELVEKMGHIQGHVTIRDTGEAVANQYVYAYRQDGGWDWASAVTDENGSYDLLVVGPAKWTVYTYASGLTTNEGKSIIYSGGGVTVNLTVENETVTGQDFIFDVADATASFTTQDDTGTDLTDQYGWVSLNTSDTSTNYGWSSTGCYIQRGTCSVALASDVTYTPSYYSYNWYTANTENSYSFSHLTVDGVQSDSLTLEVDDAQEVMLVLTENNSSITGSFVDTDGNPVKVTGYVYASGDNNRWVSTYVDNASSYTLKVADGTYDVSYWVNGDWRSSYKKSKKVEVSDDEAVELDLVVLEASATISGAVLDPDGMPVTTPVFVQASTSYGTEHTSTEDDYGLISQTTYTDSDGTFSMSVPEGKYYLTASSPDYLSPQPVKVKADNAGSSKNLTLAFISADATITGTVSDGVGITVNAQRTQAEGDVISDAFVYVYCVGGSYSSTSSDTKGLYALQAPIDDTCYVGGMYQTEGMVWYSKQEKVKTKNETVEQDLVLSEPLELPEAQTAKFDPQEGAVIELENGVRVEIPANAITADETVTEVTVVVTPVAEVIHQPGLEPISIAYNMTATDENGNPISKFASDVKIIIPYDDDTLEDAGTDEDHIQTNYYEDAAGTWQGVEGGVIKNKDENQFEISVQHFSVFAIVASRSIAVEDTAGTEEGDGGEGEEVDETETVEGGILGIPNKVKVKQRANGSIVVTWKQADNAAEYQVKLSTTKKTVKKMVTDKHRVVLKKLKAKKTYRVQVRSLGSTGSKSGWSIRVKVKLSNKKTSALVHRAELFN
ncbi:MAG: hypothetical protein ACD_41C00385G0004 [uncultured bacterium]|nr:MAG: hypothetical protein ACD_41C00385G0004 [uncultured bacterium]HBY73806.1 hypothetical protein [Candidatus Kerfeldbacteria bacterium]